MSPEDKDTVTAEETAPEIEKKEKKMARVQKRKPKDDHLDDQLIVEVENISGPSALSAKKDKTKKAADNESQAHSVPDGWTRKTVIRKKGKSAGQVDVYFFAPSGTKLRSKPEVKSYLVKNKLQLKIEDFDFSKRLEEPENVSKEPSKKIRKVESAEEVLKDEVAQSQDPKENGKKLNKNNLDAGKSSVKKGKDKSVSPKKVIKEIVQITAFKKKRTRK